MLAKRCVDIALSSLVLLLLSPILIVVALAVWLGSGSPILFCQERVGLRFRRFHFLKFRTMRVGDGRPVTVAGDDRITRVGRFLRATKLDELPQFWNVLRGDMSLVGPRPEVPEYVDLFRERYRTVLTVRPGITDLASIHFRNEEEVLSRSADPLREYAERVLPAKLDLAEEYASTHGPRRHLHLVPHRNCNRKNALIHTGSAAESGSADPAASGSKTSSTSSTRSAPQAALNESPNSKRNSSLSSEESHPHVTI
jgi:lipopolysaccharide/colanic/teichoic acid biosynthesis glycosyltransferase